ncbi:MAG: EAL domain-containing protein, partial [Rubrivivax sp.]
RLDVRIVVLFLALLLLVQAASLMALRRSIEAKAQVQVAGELRTGESVLQRLLVQTEQKLTDGARLLAADYGFRAAIASDDKPTITDALHNQGSRIGATAVLFTDARQRLVASTLQDPSQLLALVQSTLRGAPGSAAQPAVQVLDGAPFQLVSVVVKAPQVIGHVSIGFPLTNELLRDMENLSALKMALLARPLGQKHWALLPVSEGDSSIAMLPLIAQLRDDAPHAQLVSNQGQFGAHLVPLARNATHEVAALLLRSVDEAVAPYRALQWTLLLITVLGLMVFGIGSLLTARRITGPIKQLSASAERLGAGDFDTPISVTSRDEVHELARSFEAMRKGMQQRNAQIRRLAYWDPLTGLPNRAQLRDLLRDAISDALRRDRPCALLMLDLDRFKHVNDVLGHAFGDRLLKQIAIRLTGGTLREGDIVARLSGDEFAVLLPGADVDTATQIALRLRQALEVPLMLDEQTVDVSAGVGIAVAPLHGSDADLLLSRVEVAMYAAKERQAGVTVYSPALDAGSAESLSLLSELRTAVDHDQLRLFLQPKVELATGTVLGAEALVRWIHPQRGMVAPMSFIPFAEQTGFIRVLTGWMIERCAARSSELRAQGLPLKFAINLSTRDLLDQDLPAKLEKLLARHAMDPRKLCMEITESAIMDDPQRALQTLHRLHAMGLRLSIDDFGTGYSSLAYLKQMPLHELKIDKSFVMAMERDRADLKIVRSTIDLAHNLGLSVVAEGIENEQVWGLLRAMKCDEAQGYFIAKPMPEEHFAEWLRDWNSPEGKLNSELAALV